MIETKRSQAHRILFIDIIRLILIVPISMMHVWEFLIGMDIPNSSHNSTFYPFYRSVLGPIFNYAAFYILMFSFFLWGYRETQPSFKKWFILILGFIGLQLQNPMDWMNFSSWTWDIYGFLFTAAILVRILPRYPKFMIGVCGFAILTLSMPAEFWLNLGFQDDSLLNLILFPNREQSNGWFLFPWIMVPASAYAFGFLFQDESFRKRFVSHSKIIMGILSFLALGFFLVKQKPIEPLLAQGFNQFLFYQHPVHFWQHLCVFGLILYAVQIGTDYFLNNKYLIFVSRLQWNKNFFFCYLLHFAFIHQFLEWRGDLLSHPEWIAWLWLIVLVLTEMLAQMLFISLKIYRLIFIAIQERISGIFSLK